MAEKLPSLRMGVGKGLGIDAWPDGFVLNLGHDPNNLRMVSMHKEKCTDCKGSGRVMLFSSDAPCDRCLQQGFYFEGTYGEQ